MQSTRPCFALVDYQFRQFTDMFANIALIYTLLLSSLYFQQLIYEQQLIIERNSNLTILYLNSSLNNTDEILRSLNVFKVENADSMAAIDALLTRANELATKSNEVQETILEAIRALPEELAPAIKAQALAAVDEVEWSLTGAEMTGAAVELDACAYDPLGLGPIVCAGIELEGFEIIPAKLISIPLL